MRKNLKLTKLVEARIELLAPQISHKERYTWLKEVALKSIFFNEKRFEETLLNEITSTGLEARLRFQELVLDTGYAVDPLFVKNYALYRTNRNNLYKILVQIGYDRIEALIAYDITNGIKNLYDNLANPESLFDTKRPYGGQSFDGIVNLAKGVYERFKAYEESNPTCLEDRAWDVAYKFLQAITLLSDIYTDEYKDEDLRSLDEDAVEGIAACDITPYHEAKLAFIRSEILELMKRMPNLKMSEAYITKLSFILYNRASNFLDYEKLDSLIKTKMGRIDLLNGDHPIPYKYLERKVNEIDLKQAMFELDNVNFVDYRGTYGYELNDLREMLIKNYGSYYFNNRMTKSEISDSKKQLEVLSLALQMCEDAEGIRISRCLVRIKQFLIELSLFEDEIYKKGFVFNYELNKPKTSLRKLSVAVRFDEKLGDKVFRSEHVIEEVDDIDDQTLVRLYHHYI